jgi:hypothetical protein
MDDLGRGESELLPDKGNPFQEERKPREEGYEDQVVIPTGQERSEVSSNPKSDDDRVHHDLENLELDGSPEDGGMSAVGPLLPEDLEAVELPPPSIEIELPGKESAPVYSTLQEEPEVVEDSLPPFLRSSNRGASLDSESLLVSDIRINWLLEKADQLEQRIEAEIENLPLRKLLHKQIDLTRRGQIESRDQFDEAERILNEVENRIELAGQVRAWSASIRTRLAIYEIVLSMVIIIGLVGLPNLVAEFFATNFPEQTAGHLGDLENLVKAMLWGGMGGLTSAFIGLQTHASVEEEVDRQWAIWYIAAPFMGIVLGALLFLATRAGLLVFVPSSGGQIGVAWVLYALSWLLGFQQNVAYEAIERVVGLFERKR